MEQLQRWLYVSPLTAVANHYQMFYLDSPLHRQARSIPLVEMPRGLRLCLYGQRGLFLFVGVGRTAPQQTQSSHLQ